MKRNNTRVRNPDVTYIKTKMISAYQIIIKKHINIINIILNIDMYFGF